MRKFHLRASKREVCAFFFVSSVSTSTSMHKLYSLKFVPEKLRIVATSSDESLHLCCLLAASFLTIKENPLLLAYFRQLPCNCYRANNIHYSSFVIHCHEYNWAKPILKRWLSFSTINMRVVLVLVAVMATRESLSPHSEIWVNLRRVDPFAVWKKHLCRCTCWLCS